MGMGARWISFTAMIALAATAARAAPPAGGDDAGPVRASLLASVDAAVPGESFLLGLRLEMQPHWHTYWIDPGESGAPTKIKLTGPAGMDFGPIQWPLPTRIDAPGGTSYGYENEVLLLVPVNVSAALKPGGDATIAADASWLCCKEVCISGSAKLTLTLPVRAQAMPANAELFDQWRQSLPARKDDAVASSALLSAEPAPGTEASGKRALILQWRQPVKKVEWFPISTPAVAIEDVVIAHDAKSTRIEFKPTVFQPGRDAAAIESVLVYEDGVGRRKGISIPVGISKGG